MLRPMRETLGSTRASGSLTVNERYSKSSETVNSMARSVLTGGGVMRYRRRIASAASFSESRASGRLSANHCSLSVSAALARGRTALASVVGGVFECWNVNTRAPEAASAVGDDIGNGEAEFINEGEEFDIFSRKDGDPMLSML
jgi:ATP-dependent DNA ligase